MKPVSASPLAVAAMSSAVLVGSERPMEQVLTCLRHDNRPASTTAFRTNFLCPALGKYNP